MNRLLLVLPAGALGALLALLALGTIGIAPVLAAPAGAGTTTISGTVVDGTAASHLPPNLKVSLDGTDASQHPLAQQVASADSRGHFTFGGVPSDGSGYTVSAEFAGVRYQTPVEVKNGEASPVTLKVYETTTSAQSLHLANVYWVFAAIDAANQQVTVLETLTLDNRGDRTYIGDHQGDPGSDAPGILPRTIRLPLPQGASDFAPLAGLAPAAVLPVANGFVDTDPVTPGQHQIVYHYRMAFADGGVEISKTLPYPADHLIFLAPDGGLQYRSDKLGNGGTTQIDGKTYDVLGVDNLPANQSVTVDVLGLPNPPTSRLDAGTLQLVAIGAAVPFLLVALILGIRASARGRRDSAAERRALLAGIAHLDDRWEAGQIDRDHYAAEREKQKQALALLMLREAVSAGRRASPADG
jgi:hypothetical protein